MILRIFIYNIFIWNLIFRKWSHPTWLYSIYLSLRVEGHLCYLEDKREKGKKKTAEGLAKNHKNTIVVLEKLNPVSWLNAFNILRLYIHIYIFVLSLGNRWHWGRWLYYGDAQCGSLFALSVGALLLSFIRYVLLYMWCHLCARVKIVFVHLKHVTRRESRHAGSLLARAKTRARATTDTELLAYTFSLT